MKINKRAKSFIAIYAIAGTVYILLFALIPFAKPPASWVMFAFSLISIVAGCGMTLYAFEKEEGLMSKFYGFPIFRLGFLYALFQIGLSVIFYGIGAFVDIPYWIGLIPSLLLAGGAAAGMIAADNAKDYIEEIDTKTAVATKTITYFQIDIRDLEDICENETLRAPLHELAVKFRYSDPVSSPATAEKEEQIKAELEALKALIVAEETERSVEKIKQISNLLSSRNRICEASKE